MPTIPKYLAPRTDLIPIKNKYNLVNAKYKFHIALYYIGDYEAKIIIRRMDNENGWDQELILHIYDERASKMDSISLKSSDENTFISSITTKIKIIPVDLNYHQLIPKTIIQTFRTNKAQSVLHYNTVLAWQELNPEYEYVFFDDVDSREFIRKYFPIEVLNAYDLLVPGSYKADLFRYCYLYKHGGCYFDCKLIPIIPLREIIKSNDKMILCKDCAPMRYYNAVIMSTSLHPAMDEAILLSTYLILKRSYKGICGKKDDDLFITGPGLLFDAVDRLSQNDKNKISVALEMNCFTVKNKNNKLFINGMNPDYYCNYDSTLRYGNLFSERKIYYTGPYNIEQYSIYIYPHEFKDEFEFKILDGELLIKRIDSPGSGWVQNLKIKIINNNTNSVENIIVGASEDNVIGINLEKRVIESRIEPRGVKLIGNHYEILSNNNLQL